jgi:hypothetical protein
MSGGKKTKNCKELKDISIQNIQWPNSGMNAVQGWKNILQNTILSKETVFRSMPSYQRLQKYPMSVAIPDV